MRLDERARAVGVDVTLELWNDRPRIWHMVALIPPEGQRAIERIGELMRAHTG
jgi:epsilon-lactone hydrolase